MPVRHILPFGQFRLRSRAFYWLGGLHPKTKACSPVNSQLGGGHDCGRRPVDRLDHDRVSGAGAAGAHRRDGLLPAYAPAGGAAQAAWLGCGVDPLSVDGMIVAASTTLLADSRAGERGGVLPWGCWLPAAPTGGDPELLLRIIRPGAAGLHQPGPLEPGQGRMHLAGVQRMHSAETVASSSLSQRPDLGPSASSASRAK